MGVDARGMIWIRRLEPSTHNEYSSHLPLYKYGLVFSLNYVSFTAGLRTIVHSMQK